MVYKSSEINAVIFIHTKTENEDLKWCGMTCCGIAAKLHLFNPWQPNTCCFLFALDAVVGEQGPQRGGMARWISNAVLSKTAPLGPDLAKAYSRS